MVSKDTSDARPMGKARDYGGPAFPSQYQNYRGDLARDPGMSLRDWFAGQALTGLLATGENSADAKSDGWAWHVSAAYAMADAMLARRKT